jgi:SAM-dependent methyltransferase
MGVSILHLAVAAGIAIGILGVVVFWVVPAVLRAGIGVAASVANDWRERVLLRYQGLCRDGGFPILRGTFAWVFAWFKLRLDPMFGELPGFLNQMPDLRNVLDIGCGYGVAGCALLEWRNELRIHGIEPVAGRARVARAVFAERGEALVGIAPEIELPGLPDRFDAVIVLDVIHFISDSGLELALRRIRQRMNDGGYLLIRSIIPPASGGSWAWRAAKFRRAITGGIAHHRSVERIQEMLSAAGFQIEKTQTSGGNPELVWFISRAGQSGAAGSPPG